VIFNHTSSFTARVGQLVERQTLNLNAAGASLAVGSIPAPAFRLFPLFGWGRGEGPGRKSRLEVYFIYTNPLGYFCPPFLSLSIVIIVWMGARMYASLISLLLFCFPCPWEAGRAVTTTGYTYLYVVRLQYFILCQGFLHIYHCSLLFRSNKELYLRRQGYTPSAI
jgi:hypothetical protein